MCKVPNLFSLLYEYHISQKQFADLFNVSAGNVSDWKNGRSAPNIEKLVEIADYYKVTVDYLLGRDDKKISPVITTEDGYNELAERITHLSHSELEELDLYLAFLEYRRNLRS